MGEDLGDSIDDRGIRSCVLFDSGPLDETNKRIVDYFFAPSYLSDTRYPLVVFNFNKTLLSATWTGSSWEKSVILSDAAYTSFDVEKTGRNDFRLYHAQRDVWIFTTSDGGTSWEKKHRIEPEEGAANKVILIENAHSDLHFVALETGFDRYDGALDSRQYEGTYRVWAGKEIEHNPIRSPIFKKTLIDEDSRHYMGGAVASSPDLTVSSSSMPSNAPSDVVRNIYMRVVTFRFHDHLI